MKCLADHRVELSADCQSQIQKRYQARQAHVATRFQSCQNDIVQFCKDAKVAGGALAKCLKSHEAEISPACKGSAMLGTAQQ